MELTFYTLNITDDSGHLNIGNVLKSNCAVLRAYIQYMHDVNP